MPVGVSISRRGVVVLVAAVLEGLGLGWVLSDRSDGRLVDVAVALGGATTERPVDVEATASVAPGRTPTTADLAFELRKAGSVVDSATVTAEVPSRSEGPPRVEVSSLLSLPDPVCDEAGREYEVRVRCDDCHPDANAVATVVRVPLPEHPDPEPGGFDRDALRYDDVGGLVESGGSVAYAALAPEGAHGTPVPVWGDRELNPGRYDFVGGPLDVGGRPAFVVSPADEDYARNVEHGSSQRVLWGGHPMRRYAAVRSLTDVDDRPAYVASTYVSGGGDDTQVVVHGSSRGSYTATAGGNVAGASGSGIDGLTEVYGQPAYVVDFGWDDPDATDRNRFVVFADEVLHGHYDEDDGEWVRELSGVTGVASAPIQVETGVAYAAEVDGGREAVVADDAVGPTFEAVSALQTVGGDPTYAASETFDERGPQLVVHGDDVGKRYEWVSEGSITAVGGDPAYRARRRDPVDGRTELESPSGRDAGGVVVSDGDELGTEYGYVFPRVVDVAGDLAYAARTAVSVPTGGRPDDRRTAVRELVVRDGADRRPAFDRVGRRIPPFAVGEAVAYSAFLPAHATPSRREFLVYDGRRTRPFHSIRWAAEVGGRLVFVASTADDRTKEVLVAEVPSDDGVAFERTEPLDEVHTDDVVDVDGTLVFFATDGGTVYRYSDGPIGDPPDLENRKADRFYEDTSTFLVPDDDWRKVVSSVPVAVWDDGDETVTHPLLLYQQTQLPDAEEVRFDPDSAIRFLGEYDPADCKLIGETPDDLEQLLTMPSEGTVVVREVDVDGETYRSRREYEAGGGLDEEQLSRVDPETELTNYWEEFRDVVVVPSRQRLAETAMVAAEYAALIDAPLLVENYNTDAVDLSEKFVVSVGGGADVYADLEFGTEQLQRRYLERTDTDKVVLTNTRDAGQYAATGLGQPRNFTSDLTADRMTEIYTADSFVAPILGAAKHELIVDQYDTTVNRDPSDTSDAFHDRLAELGVDPDYLTVVASAGTVPYRSFEWHYAGHRIYSAGDPSEYGDTDGDERPDVAVGRITGLTTTDTATLVARSIHYDEFDDGTDVTITASGSYLPPGYTYDDVTTAEDWATVFRDSGFDVTLETKADHPDGEAPTFDPGLWTDADLVVFKDHGFRNVAGISSSDIPRIPNAVVSLDACLTAAPGSVSSTGYGDHEFVEQQFVARAIRKGAVGVMGAVGWAFGGVTVSPPDRAFLNGLYHRDQDLGTAFRNAFSDDAYEYTYTLFGDPTLNPAPGARLNEPLEW